MFTFEVKRKKRKNLASTISGEQGPNFYDGTKRKKRKKVEQFDNPSFGKCL